MLKLLCRQQLTYLDFYIGMGICHYNHQAYDLALTCLEGAVKIRKYRVSRFTDSAELVELYSEEVALGSEFFNLGNVHMQMGDYAQAMQCFVQSRDLRWCHVGSGTVDKILDKYFTERTVDEDELLGLGEYDACCVQVYSDRVTHNLLVLTMFASLFAEHSALPSQHWGHV